MFYILITKKNNVIAISYRGKDDILLIKTYFDYSKKEALKMFKKEFDLKYKRNIIILDDN